MAGHNWFKELKTTLDELLLSDFAEIYLWQVEDKISWCWKWKKITEKEKDILYEKAAEVTKKFL